MLNAELKSMNSILIYECFCFGADPSVIAAFTYDQTNRAKGGNAPGSETTGQV